MKIISWNVNGIRSVAQKGFSEFIKAQSPDFLCLQEIKVANDSIPTHLANLQGYFCNFNCATRPGYAGVAIYSRKKPKEIKSMFGSKRFSDEGRFLELDFGSFKLINLYMPHGGREKQNLEYKLQAYDEIIKYFKERKGEDIIVTGDFNIAHKEIDLANFKTNRNNIMFTPSERSQIDRLIEIGLVDSFRVQNSKGRNYTWWPYRNNLRQRNVGWRLDYVFFSSSFKQRLTRAEILSSVTGSDHCPIGVEIKD